MGSVIFHNQRMNENLDTDSDNSDPDPDQDIERILRYFFLRGLSSRSLTLLQLPNDQLHVISSSNCSDLYEVDSEDEMSNSPKDENLESSSLENNDLSHTIKFSCGALNKNSYMYPMPSMLRSRELGLKKNVGFSQGDRCQIIQRVLPNQKETPLQYNRKVFCGTFSKNGDMFMSAAQDYCIRLYDTSEGHFNLKRTIEARDVGWSILDTVLSPDGRHFAYCSWSESIHICSTFGDKDAHEALPLNPDERRFCVFALRFSQDGREILGGANDECLYVYDREDNRRTLKIHSHEDDVNTVAFADNTSQILFSGGDDGVCKVWDRRTLCETQPKPVGFFVGHKDGITYVDSKGDGRYLITNSKDQTIKLWDMRAFSPSFGIEVSRRAVAAHNWDYRWQRVPSSLSKSKMKLSGDTSLMTYQGHSVLQTLIRCHFSPEATTGQCYIYTGCARGNVVVYDVLTGEIKTRLNGHTGCVRDVSWHPYLNEILSSSWDGNVVRWTYNNADDPRTDWTQDWSPVDETDESS